MDLRWRNFRCAIVVAALAIGSGESAHAQGLFCGCRSLLGCGSNSCGCNSCGCNSSGGYGTGYGAADGTTAAAGTGDQLALDLGEAAPAQAGEMFSMVDGGYIDDARIRTWFRGRFDAGFNNRFPDRAEFFYPQCGCFGPQAPGPGNSTVPRVTTSVDYQEFWAYYEQAFSQRFSMFVDVPFRLVNFNFDPAIRAIPGFATAQPIPNSGGLSDIQFGGKFALVADPNRYDTIQLRVYTPTGDADKGLGTNHFTIEPAYLGWRQVTDRLRAFGEFRVWVPFSDSQFNGQNFAGTVLRYGLGTSYDVYQSCDCCNRLSGVFEIVGWNVTSGLKFNPFTGPQSAAGDNIVNAKFGGRWTSANRSFYMGYGRALSNETWYAEIFRAEYAYAF